MPASESKSSSMSGVTLVEVLVALVVLGLLLASLAALMHFTYGFAAVRMRNGEADAETVPVTDYLDTLIGDVRPALFDGLTDRLTVVATLASPIADVGGLQLIRLDVSAHALRIAWTPYGVRAFPAPGGAGSTALMPGLSTVRFRYFGRSPAGNVLAWHDTWTGMPVLPALVDVTMTRTNGDILGDVIVAPRVTGIASLNQP